MRYVPAVHLSLETLNGPQRDAVVHDKGPLVVFAGAGSGKTRVITYRIAQLIAQQGVAPYRILAVTFTNKAAGEMRERLSSLLAHDVHDIWVGTFHSTCARMLRRYHELCGVKRDFVIYDDADQKAMVTRVLNDFGFDDRRYDPKKVAGAINKAKQEVVGPESYPSNDAWTEVIKKVYTAYEERMTRSGALDFGDLIYRLVRSVESNELLKRELASRFDHILVDEFQDTNRVQFRLVKDLSEQKRNLCVVGDDDQSIYRWRGADRRNILDFRREYPDATIIKLEQNYRSTKKILRAAHSVVSRNVDREEKTLWTENAEGAPILVVRSADERDEAHLAVATAREVVHAGRKLSDIAIFYRIHAQSRVFEEALRAANLPYQVIGGTRFYDRAEVKDILAYLRVISNPDDDVSLLRIVNVPTRGIGKTSIDRVLDRAAKEATSVWATLEHIGDDASIASGTRKKLIGFVSMMNALRDKVAGGMGPAEVARAILEETAYQKALRDEDTPEADARLENIQELLGSMDEFENEAETPTLSAFLENVTLQTNTANDDSEDRITMMTVHAAKGLEFPVVFVGGLEEQMFPYHGYDAGDDPDELEEERRLAYVAFTRAREKLILSWAALRRVFGQPRINPRSRFLDELPRADIEEIGGAPSPSYASQRSSGWDDNSGYQRPWQHPQRSRSERPMMGTPRTSTTPARKSSESYIDRSEVEVGEDGIRMGMRVAHAKYGVGEVRGVTPGVPPKVTVSFPGWGTKQIVASFLEPA